MMPEREIQEFDIADTWAGQRVDKVLSGLCPSYSRARIQGILAAGGVFLNGVLLEQASQKVRAGDHIRMVLPALVEATPAPENIPLNVVYEDSDLLVINKPAGLVVHPGAGNHTGTLVNALLYHCAGALSGIGGVLRPGIVHRLDKETSGLMVVAKTDQAHQGLSAQLEDRSLSRIYEALVLHVPTPLKGLVDKAIGRDPRNRLKMAINGQGAREARTHYHVQEIYKNALARVLCQLETGRTHQIRVHMASIKHPLIGDPVYGAQPTAVGSALKKAGFSPETVEACLKFPRQALHARDIAFIHPVRGDPVVFVSPLPVDLYNLLKSLK